MCVRLQVGPHPSVVLGFHKRYLPPGSGHKPSARAYYCNIMLSHKSRRVQYEERSRTCCFSVRFWECVFPCRRLHDLNSSRIKCVCPAAEPPPTRLMHACTDTQFVAFWLCVPSKRIFLSPSSYIGMSSEVMSVCPPLLPPSLPPVALCVFSLARRSTVWPRLPLTQAFLWLEPINTGSCGPCVRCRLR